jgi:soluble lytic murein transglycosylase
MIKKQHLLSPYILLICVSVAILLCALIPSAAYSAEQAPVPQIKPETTSEGLLDAASSLLGLKKDSKTQSGQKLSEIEKLLIKSAKQKSGAAMLPKSDAALYKTAFEAQEQGNIKQSDSALKKISDLRLLGHVLYQRYMHPDSYRSNFRELKIWLDFYADHPGADKIYRLAQSRMPSGYKGKLNKPVKAKIIAQVREPTMHTAKPYVPKRGSSQAAASIDKKVSGLLEGGRNADALAYIQDPSVAANLDAVQYDTVRADIAAGLLYSGDAESAYALAAKSFSRSGKFVPRAGWIAGLISWKSKRYKEAARYFEVAAHSEYASGWLQASAAYWAARSHMRVGNVKPVSAWLERGKKYPRTFYGLISTRALGRDFDFNWKMPTFTSELRDVLASIPAGSRAMALIESGQLELAQSELLRVEPSNAQERDALLAYAGYVNLPGLSMRMASALAGAEQTYDAALYPDSPWQPQKGYRIDPALMHAIIRQESKFDPEAESSSGALGLMQIMPATAKRVVKKGDLVLEDPELNLEIGQRYIEQLMKQSAAKDDLFMLMIAYNAGPGNLAKWKKRWPDVDDPLLFIELIPAGQTRTYVEHVLANYWIYRMKDDQPVPSLDSIVSGKEAHYAAP